MDETASLWKAHITDNRITPGDASGIWSTDTPESILRHSRAVTVDGFGVTYLILSKNPVFAYDCLRREPAWNDEHCKLVSLTQYEYNVVVSQEVLQAPATTEEQVVFNFGEEVLQ